MRRSPASRVTSTGCAEPITRPVYARPAAQPRRDRAVRPVAASPSAPRPERGGGLAAGSAVTSTPAHRARAPLLALALLLALVAPAAAGPTVGADHPWPRRPRPGPVVAATVSPPLHLAEAQLATASWLDPRIGMTEGWRDLAHLQESLAGSDRVLFSWAALEPDGPQSFRPEA